MYSTYVTTYEAPSYNTKHTYIAPITPHEAPSYNTKHQYIALM